MTNQTPAPTQVSQPTYERPLTVPIYSTGQAERFANSWLGSCRRACQALGRDHILLEFPQPLAAAVQETLGSLQSAQSQTPILFRIRQFNNNEVLWTIPDDFPERRAVRETTVYPPQAQPQMTQPQPMPAPVAQFPPQVQPLPQTQAVPPQPQMPQHGQAPDGAAGTYKGVPVAAQQPSGEPGMGINDAGKVTRVQAKRAKNA